MSMRKQVTSSILMIRPASFKFNEQTASNNYYQKVLNGLSRDNIQSMALEEFDLMVDKLRAKGMEVIVIEDDNAEEKPDAIFPNNWISFHLDGKVGIYPMYAVNRRLERRKDIIQILKETYHFHIEEILNFTGYEKENKFLESTGSMVLDRVNQVAYAALSNRTNEEALVDFCQQFGYQPLSFNAFQTVGGERRHIYHTNVMMCVAEKFVVICVDAIDDINERKKVITSLTQSGHEFIYLSEEQNQRFAGNMLQVQNREKENFLVMSDSAFSSLDSDQKDTISKYCQIIHSNLDVIEACGGGSARCMMAEIFLPEKGTPAAI